MPFDQVESLRKQRAKQKTAGEPSPGKVRSPRALAQCRWIEALWCTLNVIELKRLLEGRRHALLGDLMACIAALLKDYKHEVRARGRSGHRA